MATVPGLVSIIVPFLDPPERFLAEAIESVLAQTYPEWELILVDDGSTDCEGARAAREWARRTTERVRLVTYPEKGNKGASAARNEGLRHARGAYVSFLDADDVWLPDKLRKEVAALRECPAAGMVYSSYRYWYGWTGDKQDAARDFVPTLGIQAGRAVPPPTFVTLFVQGLATVPTPSGTTLRRDVVDAIGGFEAAFPGLYDDQVLFAKVGLRYPVIPLSDVTTWYRQHERSICARATDAAERRARTAFLTWLEDHLERRGVVDPALRAVVRRETWSVAHPRLARVRRWLAKRVAWMPSHRERWRETGIARDPDSAGCRVP
jgi:glycosyltransferase involved in cell wall biosynthesis